MPHIMRLKWLFKKNAFEFQAMKILKKSKNKNDKMHLSASMIIISRNNMQSLAFDLTLSVSNTQKDGW